MRQVFVGDLHSKRDLLERIVRQEQGSDKIYLVGDYVDTHERDKTPLHSIQTLEYVLELVETTGGKVQALAGNHEMSYLWRDVHGCSGFERKTNTYFLANRHRILRLLKSFFLLEDPHIGKILVTHAGLSLPVWQEMEELSGSDLGNKFSDRETLSIWASRIDRSSPAHWIGLARGGMAECGGIFWCDYGREFQHIYRFTQIFGHTPVGEITKHKLGTNYNIDCLANTSPAYLVLENGQWEIEPA